MTSEQSRRDRWDAHDAIRAEASWGMAYVPEDPPYDPIALAQQAAARGDVTFLAEIVTSAYQGGSEGLTSYSRVMRAQPYDYVGGIERAGWVLHSMSSCFAQRGTRLGQLGQVAINGDVIVAYLFRRAGT